MNETTLIQLLPPAVAALVTLLVVPIAIDFAKRFGLADQPNARKVHQTPTFKDRWYSDFAWAPYGYGLHRHDGPSLENGRFKALLDAVHGALDRCDVYLDRWVH